MIKVIKFWSEHCGPCVTIKPIIEKVLNDFPNIELVDINTNEDQNNGGDKISEYGVRSIPAIFIEKDGEIIDKFVGMKSENDLRELFKNISEN